MANEIIQTTGKLSDALILSLFKKISEAYGISDSNIQYGPISTKLDKAEELIGKKRTYSF